MFLLWGTIGIWVFYSEWKEYYKRMSQPVDGIEYDKFFRLKLSNA